jgi:hypothetical protein
MPCIGTVTCELKLGILHVIYGKFIYLFMQWILDLSWLKAWYLFDTKSRDHYQVASRTGTSRSGDIHRLKPSPARNSWYLVDKNSMKKGFDIGISLQADLLLSIPSLTVWTLPHFVAALPSTTGECVNFNLHAKIKSGATDSSVEGPIGLLCSCQMFDVRRWYPSGRREEVQAVHKDPNIHPTLTQVFVWRSRARTSALRQPA